MPRTITKTVYELSELEGSAKEEALHNMILNFDYPWGSENEDTLREFEKIFPVKVKRFQYGGYGGKYIDFDFENYDEIADLSGIRLMKYIYNNYFYDIYKGKYYNKCYAENGRFIHKYRYSKIKFEECCNLTGYCIDIDILKPIWDFLKNPNDFTTFEDLMQECLESWLSACEKDHDGFYGEESLIEHAEINNIEFDENGNIV